MTESIPAADLIARGECSAACLLAHPSTPCTCRCGDLYHAALLDARVPLAAGWWDARPGGFKPQEGRSIRDSDGPVLDTAADFRARWHGDMTGPFSYVRPQPGGKWAAHEVGATLRGEGKVIVHAGFLEGLVLAGRCDSGSPGQDASAYGFRTWQEAQAAAQTMIAIDFLAADYILPCLEALAAALGGVPHPRLARAIALLAEQSHHWEAQNAMWDDPLTGPFMRALDRYRTRRALPAGEAAASCPGAVPGLAGQASTSGRTSTPSSESTW